MTKGDLREILESYGYKEIGIIEPIPYEVTAFITRGRLFRPSKKLIMELRRKRPANILIQLCRKICIFGKELTLWQGIV